MKLTRTRLLSALAAATLLSLFLTGRSWAQGDTPIVISDGSLTIESRGVPWSRFTGAGGTRRHPNGGKMVTSVDLTVNGRTQTISFSGQQASVTAQYAGTTITVSTDGSGKNLQIATDFGSFHPGSSANHLAHNDAGNHMGAITVRKGGASAFSGTGNGGTVIVIHYQ
jgi:hypothetical protein